MSFRGTYLVAFIAAMTVSAAPTFAGPLPDIRGLNFDATPGALQGIQVFGGSVAIPGFGTTFFETNPTRSGTLFDSYPGASPNPVFSVVADPSSPNDPGRIEIQTGFGLTNSPLNEIQSLNLIGSYDQTTGAINVTGTSSGATGSLLVNFGVGVNLFGNGQDFQVIVGFTSLTDSLHGIVTQGPNGLTITGTDPFVSFGGPGNIVVSGTSFVYFNPVGDYNVSDAIITGTVAPGGGYGGFYNWTATTAAVPEPASLTMLGLGLVGLLGYAWRHRNRLV